MAPFDLDVLTKIKTFLENLAFRNAKDGTDNIKAVVVVLYVKDSATGDYVPLTVTDGKISVDTT